MWTSRQCRLNARRLVPRATFVRADMATWDCEPGSSKAIVTLYALIHVPLDDQVACSHEWPDGSVLADSLAIVGYERWTGIEEYMGAPMFSGTTPTLRRTSRRLSERSDARGLNCGSSQKERRTTRSFLPSHFEQRGADYKSMTVSQIPGQRSAVRTLCKRRPVIPKGMHRRIPGPRRVVLVATTTIALVNCRTSPPWQPWDDEGKSRGRACLLRCSASSTGARWSRR